MYYIAKVFQAASLAILGIGFLQSFPNLVAHKTLLIAVSFFAVGWLIQRFIRLR